MKEEKYAYILSECHRDTQHMVDSKVCLDVREAHTWHIARVNNHEYIRIVRRVPIYDGEDSNQV